VPLSVGCDPSQDLFYKRKFIQSKKGTIRDIFILERERDNKDDLSSFQAQAIKINKLLFSLV
jgi:acetylglutamate synthase